MKKNFKKLSSLALALVLASSLSASALAADITAEQAKAAALEHAGYEATEVSRLFASVDYEGVGKVYDVEFIVQNADGSYLEYDYEISASGKVREFDVDREGRAKAPAAPVAPAAPEKAVLPAAKSTADIGADAAKNAALEHFGLKAEEVKFTGLRKDYDDGVYVYEIEFCKPYEVKYSCDVVAASGAIRDVERENARNIFDKIELFFEVLIYQLLNR